jgi:hypothetical protein
MLGMIINEKMSIPKETYRRYRAIIHNCLQHGFEPNQVRYAWEGTGSFKEHLLGKLSYFSSIDPVRGGKLKEAFDAAQARWTEQKERANPYAEPSL